MYESSCFFMCVSNFFYVPNNTKSLDDIALEKLNWCLCAHIYSAKLDCYSAIILVIIVFKLKVSPY